MGDTKRVFLINRTMSEHVRVFTTLKCMSETFNEEYEQLKEKGMSRADVNSKKFNLNALRSMNWTQPQKYKGHTIRRVPVER